MVPDRAPQDDARWTEILLFLQQELASLGAPVGPWLERLHATERGRRLGACLAIDLKNNALARDLLADVLNRIPDEEDAGIAFTRAMETASSRKKYLCVSQLQGKRMHPPECYVRVMEIGHFTQYYGNPFGLTLNPRDLQSMRTMFLSERGLNLGLISNPWCGHLENVWVTSEAQIHETLAREPRTEAGTRVNELLGIGMSDGHSPTGHPEFVAILYPSSFDAPCFQPTTLDSNWDVTHCYVSYHRYDGWGRTCNLTGKPPLCPERVHLSLPDGLNMGFQPMYIGESQPVRVEQVTLIKETFARFADDLSDNVS